MLTIRLISGEARQIDGLQPDDLFVSLHEKIASNLNLLLIEICVCHGSRIFSPDDYPCTLAELGLVGGHEADVEIAVLRMPRLTPPVLEGQWMNSKGTRIVVSDLGARMAGLVTEEVKIDKEGTVVGIGDYLHVKGLCSLDMVTFRDDTWWRVGEDSNDLVVILRTVNGLARRLESLRSTDTLSALRAEAVLELQEVLDLDVKRGNVCMQYVTDELSGSGKDRVLHRCFDDLKLSTLGLRSGIALLCTRD